MEPLLRPMEDKMIDEVSSLTLAYLGDAVYDQYVRTQMLLAAPHASAHTLHKRCARLVCARGQALTIAALMDDLEEDEVRVYKRGRNAHSATVPKHADIVHYRAATGFEALLGTLWLRDDIERLNQLLALAQQKGWKETEDGTDKP